MTEPWEKPGDKWAERSCPRCRVADFLVDVYDCVNAHDAKPCECCWECTHCGLSWACVGTDHDWMRSVLARVSAQTDGNLCRRHPRG